MKPSIKNIVMLLIGKVAVTTTYASNISKENIFEIIDAKVENGVVYVKGINTPWLSENNINVLHNLEENYIKEDVELVCKSLLKIGVLSESNFEHLKENEIRKNIAATGCYYIVKTTKENEENYVFIKFPNGWKIINNIFYVNDIEKEDIYLHLKREINESYDKSLDIYNNNNLFVAATEAVIYFYTNKDMFIIDDKIVKYIENKFNINNNDAKFILKLIKPDNETSYISNNLKLIINEVKLILDSGRINPLQKELVKKLTEKGMLSTYAKFSSKMIKYIGE